MYSGSDPRKPDREDINDAQNLRRPYSALLQWIRRAKDKVIAVGEVGLPYYLYKENKLNISLAEYVVCLNEFIKLSNYPLGRWSSGCYPYYPNGQVQYSADKGNIEYSASSGKLLIVLESLRVN